jgi:hypothetical protein
MKRPTFVSLIALVCAGLLAVAAFFPTPALQTARQSLLDVSLLLTGVALLVAIFNLIFRFHWVRIFEPTGGLFYHFLAIAAFLVTLAFGLTVGVKDASFGKLITNVLQPVEGSLLGLVGVVLLVAGTRFFAKRRAGPFSLAFFFGLIFFLLLRSGLLAALVSSPGLLQGISFVQSLSTAGMRGILLGIALGSLIAGLRVLGIGHHGEGGGK